MKLYAPNRTLWWVGIIMGVIGIMSKIGFLTLSGMASFAEGLPILAFFILLLATSIENLQKLY